MQERRSIVTKYRLNSEIRNLIRAVPGVEADIWRNMVAQLDAQIGTPQQNVDWSNPDEWIPLRLKGTEQKLAYHLWQFKINPRWAYQTMYIAQKNGLIEKQTRLLTETAIGRSFAADAEDAVQAIDHCEGLFDVLFIVAEQPGKLGDLMGAWTSFCLTWTNHQSELPIKSALRLRLVNLIERGFIEHTSQQYRVTDLGLQYLKKNLRYVASVDAQTAKPQNDLISITRQLSKDARQQLREYLSKMNPYLFEHLVKLLLEEMGYENVQVTAPSNDKGVDVVADIQLGISSVREVVQVKRHTSNVRREVLDSLRGSLHRFDAVQGTIITLSNFADGAKKAAFERGAARITLIDGEKLIDLLTEHQIGITTKTVKYNEFDPTKLNNLIESDNSEDE